MTVKRFLAPSARECLRQVKEVLGSDAIVISNKAVDGGIEITAMSAGSLEALSSHAATPRAVAEVPRPVANGAASYAALSGDAFASAPRSRAQAEPAEDFTVTLSQQRLKEPQSYQPWAPNAHPAPAASAPPVLRPLPPRNTPAPVPTPDQVTASLDTLASAASANPQQAQVSQLMDEVQGIKLLLERQLAGFAWGNMSRESPVKAQLLGELLDAGFSGQFARKLVADLPEQFQIADARKWAKAAVGRRLRTLTTEEDLIDRGGVYALVGPTGVGKTTTTAKLAARCVVRYGAEKLALLTTDSYRIGAHEQLRIYGRILGVPVHVVRDGEDLRHTLSDLRDKHMVLIDTVGMSQRDRMVAEQAAMFARCGQVNRLLMLNATSRGDTLDDVVRAYAGEDIAGCLLTKLDETASIAPAIDTVIRHGLTVSYVTTGQRVPEDLHIPNRNYLLHRCFKTGGAESPHHLHDEEIGLAVSGSDIGRGPR